LLIFEETSHNIFSRKYYYHYAHMSAEV